MKGPGGEGYLHSLRIEGGRGYLEVEVIDDDQVDGLWLVSRALSAGTIAEVKTGRIVGPKVLNLLRRLRIHAARSGAKVVFKGEMNPSAFMFLKYVDSDNSGRLWKEGDSSFWSADDVRDFELSMKEFGIEEACRRFWSARPERCGLLPFEFTSDLSSPVVWHSSDQFE